MRHRKRGRKLGRNSSHRKAMFRNMACSLIRTARVYDEDPNPPKVPGRIVTTEPKAKELRPIVEKLITLARRAKQYEENAKAYETTAAKNSEEWKQWRNSEQWNEWNQAIAPAVALRRRAFAKLRDHEAVDILFDELSERFQDRPGGYTRIVRLAAVRLGDAGQQALIEFVGENDRKKKSGAKPQAPVVVNDEEETEDEVATATDEANEPEETASADEGGEETSAAEETEKDEA